MYFYFNLDTNERPIKIITHRLCIPYIDHAIEAGRKMTSDGEDNTTKESEQKVYSGIFKGAASGMIF